MQKGDDSIEDGFSCDDVVLIHSIRPERLFTQIKSFIDNQIEFVIKKRKAIIKNRALNKGLRNQIYIIIGDDPKEDKRYYVNRVNKIKKYIFKLHLGKNIKVIYWPYKRQVFFFNYLFSKFNDKNIKSLFHDYESNKLGGLRGVQNKSIIVADYVTRNLKGNLLYHKLDDDIYAYVASFRDKKTLKFVHGYNVFNHKANLLNKKNVRVIGSRYVIDSPSPLIDLKEGLMELNTLFEGIKRNPKDSINNWNKLSKKMYCVAETFIDESKIIQTKDSPFLYRNRKVSENLKSVISLVKILKKGNNRFLFNTIENISKGFEGFRDSLPGGFISFKKETKVVPWMTGSNQDLLFSAFENALNGGVYGDLPVGHIKSLNRRKFLIDSLIVGNRHGISANDFVTMSFILKIGERMGFRLAKNIPYNKSIYGWGLNFIKPDDFKFMLDNADINLKWIIEKKAFHDKKLQRGLSYIKNFFNDLRTNWENISNSFDYNIKDKQPKKVAEEIFSIWYNNLDNFHKIREFVSTIEKEF